MVIYTVKNGDSLYNIARRYGSTAAVLAAYYGKSRAENTKGGITYDAALGRDESC